MPVRDQSLSEQSSVRALGYVRLGVSAPAAWDEFAANVLGLQAGEPGAGGARRFRMDARSFRLEMIPNMPDEIVGVGWEVVDAGALSAVAERLTKAGTAVEMLTGEALAGRGVQALLRCADPSGTPLEIFWGAKTEISPFVSPRGVRFITDNMGLGHVVLAVARSGYYDTLDFYRGLLGFKMSDHMAIGDREATFFHCNPRHHSLAIVKADAGPKLIHFMLEASDLDSVGYALDACYVQNARVKRTLGRHSNDRMVSFYVQSPSEFDVEFGWGGRLIDDTTWTVTELTHGTLWGHRPAVQANR